MNAPGPPGPPPPGRPRAFMLRTRIWVYVLILGSLLAFRVAPGLIARWKASEASRNAPRTLTLAGLDLAPALIPRIVDAYRVLYPEIQFKLLPGGTRQALEDLFNLRADVAFTSRPMTAEELQIVQAIGDTALTFPVALGGIGVLGAAGSPPESLSVEGLRRILRGEKDGAGAKAVGTHLYAADPNLGLWTALTSQLDLPDSTGAPITWLATDFEVIQAVAADRGSLGFVSTLALPADLERRGVRGIDLRGHATWEAAPLSEGNLAGGAYPLYHYLYVSCRPGGGPLASGFVSFLSSGKGQRLVEREGFLPARSMPREIELVQRPIGTTG
jgi:ABC-type phosphate transport system substrate-binding protein